ncbi:MAG: glycosyltransferase family 2 protein [Lachnospiraceae bacterium]|nr:glycosyltransferase family 2 protein [Lachnospiraceae bacterium]
MGKEVTVVIPNYNGIAFLKGCLEALLNQEPGTPDFHVLVVDNGSSDGSLELLREEFPGVEVEALPENTGFCHAVNVGIQKARTPYVILLNNDTRVDAGFIRALYEAMEKRPEAFSVSARMLMWDRPELMDDGGDRYCVLGWACARGKGRDAGKYDKPAEVFSACAGAAIYRRQAFEQIGLFDEEHFAYLEDLDIGWRAKIYGWRNFYEPRAKVVHYGSASSGSRYNEWKTSLAAANNVYVAGKNMPLLQWILNLPFLILGSAIKLLFFCRKGMGGIYLKGLGKGIRKLASKAGRAHRIRFRAEFIKNYLAIQGQLYLNLIRILKKT